jgi:pimeloyl-ACP methyl ester carboxylesterase
MKLKFYLIFLLCNLSLSAFCQDTLKVSNVEAILYKNRGDNQKLIVGLGGSEGGNAWVSDRWKARRDEFISQGYAFLAIGYFGCKGTPSTLNRISIEDVYGAIKFAEKEFGTRQGDITLIGGSRGADLALLLASYYSDIKCVIGMSSSHAVFPGHTQEFTTSCWMYNSEDLPFIPVNDEAIPFLIKRNLRGAFEAMMKDTVAEEKALIKVESIRGAILLLSATNDQIIPAVSMGEKIVERLKNNQFKYPYKHIVLEGMHDEPMKHFDLIFEFLEQTTK